MDVFSDICIHSGSGLIARGKRPSSPLPSCEPHLKANFKMEKPHHGAAEGIRKLELLILLCYLLARGIVKSLSYQGPCPSIYKTELSKPPSERCPETADPSE
jgi:hypothetical protein